MTYDPRALDKLLAVLSSEFDVPETDLQTLIYDTREKLVEELKFRNATRHAAREFSMELYLTIFDMLCAGQTYEKIGEKFKVERNSIGMAVERLRQFDCMIEFYDTLKDMMRTD